MQPNSVPPEAQKRLYPSRSERTYYHLVQIRKQIERITETHVRPLNSATLIDYGCGITPYRTFFSGHVDRYLGADLPINPRADITLSAEGKLPPTLSDVDIVLSTQVLEHVDNPALYLQEAYRVLKPGGLLILSTHGYWIYHPNPGDYWRWTGSGLKKIIAEAGFSVIDFQGIMGLAPTALQLLQDSAWFRLPAIFRPPLAFVMQLCVELADKLHSQAGRNNDASVFFLVAQKIEPNE